MIKNPELLKKRLNAKKKENEQKWVLLYSGLMFLSGFIIAGLNYRYKWTEIPNMSMRTDLFDNQSNNNEI